MKTIEIDTTNYNLVLFWLGAALEAEDLATAKRKIGTAITQLKINNK